MLAKIFNKTVMLRVAAAGAVAILGGAYGAHRVNNSINQKFKGIFTGFGETTTICYDRSKVKDQLKVALSSSNPSGIIFVCGRQSAGKTTTIQAALQGRSYVAQINWRGKTLNKESDLVDSIKSAFRVADFKDLLSSFIPGINPGWLLSMVLNLLPRLDYNDNKLEELSKVQDEIEEILKFAQRGNNKNKQQHQQQIIQQYSEKEKKHY